MVVQNLTFFWFFKTIWVYILSLKYYANIFQRSFTVLNPFSFSITPLFKNYYKFKQHNFLWDYHRFYMLDFVTSNRFLEPIIFSLSIFLCSLELDISKCLLWSIDLKVSLLSKCCCGPISLDISYWLISVNLAFLPCMSPEKNQGLAIHVLIA